MMHKQKVKLLLWFAAVLCVLALVVAPVWADEPTMHTLTVEKAGDGTGTVTSDPAGINCGEDCEEAYTQGTVELTATPDEGSVFSRWDEDCLQQEVARGGTGGGKDLTDPVIVVNMDANRTCTANFGLPVGGIVVPVNRLGLLAPWAGLAALASLAALTVALVRKRRGI